MYISTIPYDAVCEVCGNKFYKHTPLQKFCSNNCRNSKYTKRVKYKLCAVNGCNERIYARFVCQKHYRKVNRFLVVMGMHEMWYENTHGPQDYASLHDVIYRFRVTHSTCVYPGCEGKATGYYNLCPSHKSSFLIRLSRNDGAVDKFKQEYINCTQHNVIEMLDSRGVHIETPHATI